jgi:hypothetical protein
MHTSTTAISPIYRVLQKTHTESTIVVPTYVVTYLETYMDIDFHELDISDITPALRAKVERVKALPTSHFINI